MMTNRTENTDRTLEKMDRVDDEVVLEWSLKLWRFKREVPGSLRETEL